MLDEVESTIYNGGVVTASHTGLHSTNYDERFIYAMDGSTSNKYYVQDADVAAGTVNVWVQWASIDNVPVIYNRLRFYTGGESNRRPKYLSVQASHGNDIWDVLWESSSVSLSSGDNYFSFVNEILPNVVTVAVPAATPARRISSSEAPRSSMIAAAATMPSPAPTVELIATLILLQ